MTVERTGPVTFPARVSEYGRDEALPERRQLRAGPLTAVLEGGDLRYVKLGDDQVVLRLYAAIRDRNWNTIEPDYRAYDVNESDAGFTVRFEAVNVAGDVDFTWQGEINGTPDGVITATMDGAASRDFLKNRIGWCVLHPMELAGVAATTETPGGPVSGVFPDLISPHQPFIDMQAISYATPSGGEVTIRFEGDLFEMEDQRNWTDASYKTYSTPLRIPYPVEIKQGDRVWQRVTITGSGVQAVDAGAGEAIPVEVSLVGGSPLPPIGLSVAGHGEPLSAEDFELLQAIHPAHLRVKLELTGDTWQQRLVYAHEQADSLGAGLEIEAIAAPDGEGISALVDALALISTPVARVLVFAEGRLDTTEEVIAAAREAFAESPVSTLVGGGTRAYFTELNRATLPLAEMQVVGYTINPQVHAFDNASLTETLAAQSETLRSARAIVGERPLAVGPVTLRPPFNPNATGAEPPTSEGTLPSSVDYRQPSLFAAGWLAGSVNALGTGGADSITYFETTGWKGIIERRDHPLRVKAFHSWQGMIFPVYHVLADVGEFARGEVLPVSLGDGLRVQALALCDDARLRVILANMGGDPVTVSLRLPDVTGARLRRLDSSTFLSAGTDATAYRRSGEQFAMTAGTTTIELPPHGLATIDAELADA